LYKEAIAEAVEHQKILSICWAPGTHGYGKPAATSTHYKITEGCNTALIHGFPTCYT